MHRSQMLMLSHVAYLLACLLADVCMHQYMQGDAVQRFERRLRAAWEGLEGWK